MLLKNAGIDHPLAVIFVGASFGICAFMRDIYASLFCLAIIVLLFSVKRFPFMISGILAGVAAAWLAVSPAGIEGEHLVSGKIDSAGFENGTMRIEIKNIIIDGKPVRGKARLNVYENVGEISGSMLAATARLSYPPGPDNFGQPDFRHSLLAENITVTGYIKDFSEIRFSGRPFQRIRPKVLLDAVGNNEAGVLNAMLTGDRSGLTQQANDIFASLGLSHLIAISGLNFALVILFGYILAFSIIRIIPPVAGRIDTPLVSKAFGLVCAVVYGFAIEPSVPTTRALIMACIMIAAFMAARRIHLIDALAFSGIIILAIWPHSLFTASFQLSFAAVLGIVAVEDTIRDRSMALKVIAVPIAASVFTLPVSVFYFGFISPLSILYNLVFVPFFSFLVMPVAFCGMIFSYVWESGAFYMFNLCMDGISLILMTGERLGKLIGVPNPGILYFYLWYLTFFILLFAKKSIWKTSIVLVCCLALVVIPPAIQRQRMGQELMFDFISVGQGDCILITKGRNAVLIDAGGSRTGFDTGRFIVGPRLLSRGITRLDLVVATHSHPDHVGGMPFILERFDVGQVWINCDNDPDFTDVLLVTDLKQTPVRTVSAGDAISFPNGLKIDVLHPQHRLVMIEKRLDLNLHSIVVMAGDDRLKGLFMADSDMFGEVNMMHMGVEIKADVLKAAHHGSRKSCLDDFLKAVRPELAVVTCGRRNSFGMPSQEALERIKASGALLFRTDICGEIIVSKKINNILYIKSFYKTAEKYFREDNHILSGGQ